MKFYPFRSTGCGEMASDGPTDKAVTICSPFGEHKITDKQRMPKQ